VSKSYFLQLPDWLQLREAIEDQKKERLSAALEASAPTADLAYAAREYERGWFNALEWILALPDEILKDDGQDDKSEEEPKVEGIRSAPERKEIHVTRFSRTY
jgi:hypothetical protein